MVKKKGLSMEKGKKKGEVPSIFKLPFEEESETPAVVGDVDLIPAGSIHKEGKKPDSSVFNLFFFLVL